MKIRWQKVSAGVYESDPGRFRVEKRKGEWWLTDTVRDIGPAKMSSLKEAKKLADDQMEWEAENV